MAIIFEADGKNYVEIEGTNPKRFIDFDSIDWEGQAQCVGNEYRDTDGSDGESWQDRGSITVPEDEDYEESELKFICVYSFTQEECDSADNETDSYDWDNDHLVEVSSLYQNDDNDLLKYTISEDELKALIAADKQAA